MVDKTSKEYQDFKLQVFHFIVEHSDNDCVDCAQLHEIDRFYQKSDTIRADREYMLTVGDFSDELYAILLELIDEDKIVDLSGEMAYYINLQAGYFLDLPVAKRLKKYKRLHWLPVVFRVKEQYERGTRV